MKVSHVNKRWIYNDMQEFSGGEERPDMWRNVLFFLCLLVKFLQAPADEAELLYRWHRYLLSTATKQLHKLWDAGSPVHGNEFNFSLSKSVCVYLRYTIIVPSGLISCDCLLFCFRIKEQKSPSSHRESTRRKRLNLITKTHKTQRPALAGC